MAFKPPIFYPNFCNPEIHNQCNWFLWSEYHKAKIKLMCSLGSHLEPEVLFQLIHADKIMFLVAIG